MCIFLVASHRMVCYITDEAGFVMPLSVYERSFGKFGWQNSVRLLVKGFDHEDSKPTTGTFWVHSSEPLPVGLRNRQTTFTTTSGDMTNVKF